jgi:hypothetical protein
MSKAEKQRKWADLMKIHQKRLLVQEWNKLADKVGYWVLAIVSVCLVLTGLYKLFFHPLW